jgi:Asp-tRNA(Asn)/Glu-tRNA(Gln) amidotransferase A subunit family amidase
MPGPSIRRRSAVLLAGLLTARVLAAGPAVAAGPPLNLDTLTGARAEQMLQTGQLTSVALVQAYLARITALNKSGPGLNAVTQINPNALAEAAAADQERAAGTNLGPAMGLPILLKDIIGAAPMTTTAGDWALRNSFAPDSGVAKALRAHGVVILGKAGLSEWANSFGSNPSGLSNLVGQVLNANDTAQGPSGSSSGSATAASAGLASLTIGTETAGSIISPSTAQSDVGLRPTVGLVPGYGIAPIDASQDTAGPIERTVTDAAMTLQSIAEPAGSDPTADQEYIDLMGPAFHTNGDIPVPPSVLPNYMSALTTSFVAGKRIGFNGDPCVPTGTATVCTASQLANAAAIHQAVTALTAAGAIMVPDPVTTTAALPALPTNYEQHATIDEYYKGLGPGVPVQSLVQEVAVDATNPQEALKDGNNKHAPESLVDDTPGGANAIAYESTLPMRKRALHSAIDAMMNCPGAGVANTTATVCPAGTVNPVIAVVGSVAGGGTSAGYPELALPMGYSTTQRRAIAVDVFGGAYDELNILGTSYVIEQATNQRQPPAAIDPASYRCAHTDPAEPFAGRGHCNPDFTSVMGILGGSQTVLSFPLETTSAVTLESMMAAKTLTSQQLVRAYLTRIALANAEGPAVQAVRSINPTAIADAAASDTRRAAGGSRGPLEGIPVLVDDSVDAVGLATSGGSIALEDNLPAADSSLVAKLKAAGAVILGDTNTTELGGAFDPNMPPGYSSLGGQVVLPSDTNLTPSGSSAGSAAAASAGFAALAVGLETSTDSAQLIAPAGNAGLVGLKPTVGLVSRAGVMPVARSQDAPGPIGQTMTDVATELNAIAGRDPSDPATSAAPSPTPNYLAGLTATALSGKRVAVISTSPAGSPGSVAPYPAAVAELGTLGAVTTVATPGPATKAASIIPFELHRDLDAYLGVTGGGPKSLQQVVDYNNANPVEGLKFGQGGLLAAAAVSPADPATAAAYATSLAQGRADSQGVINTILANAAGTGGPVSAIMVPSGSALVGIADRAGYPVLTVPAGYGDQNSSTGADPIGVNFIGGAFSEATLLGYGYAYEQATNVRATGPTYFVGSAVLPGVSGAPSETNQSMWRCVPGSAFFHPYLCNPGDQESSYCIDGTQIGCLAPVTSATQPTSTPSITPPAAAATPAVTPPAAVPAQIGGLKVGTLTGGRGFLSVKLSCPSGGGTCSRVRIDAFVVEKIQVTGKVVAVTAVKAAISRTVAVGGVTTSILAGATKTIRVDLNKSGLRRLVVSRSGLPTRVTVTSAGKKISSAVVTVKKLPVAKKKTKAK